MKLLGLVLCVGALLAQEPRPSPAQAGGGGGGGSGTVTSVGLVGTVNQITVTGASPITSSGSWTISFPTNVTLPGTTTGTFSGNLTGNLTGTASTATNALSLGGNLAATYAPLASPTFTGTVAIGTTVSFTATTGLGSLKDVDFLPIADAGAPTADLAGAGAGNVNNGDHSYTVTFVNASGETAPINRAFATVVDKTADGKVSLTAIPTGPAGTTSRKIYRSKANGGDLNSVWIPFLLTTLADNTTTIYTDNTADSGLGAQGSFLNSTGGAAKVNGTVEGSWTPYGLALENLAIGDYFGSDRYVSPLYLSKVFTNISDDYPNGFLEVIHLNPGAGLGAGTASGWQLQVDTAVTAENYSQIWGMALVLDHYGSGTVSDFSAIYINQDNLGGGTVTRMRGIDLTNGGLTDGGTITNYASIEIGAISTTGTIGTNVGLLIGNQNVGTSNWAIKAGLGRIEFDDLKTTGAATGKKIVCVDTATGILYASSSGVACVN